MFTVSIERQLTAPASEAWVAVSDFGEHCRSNMFIEHSTITNDRAPREGAIRELRLYDGSWMHQRIVDHHPGESMVMEVVQADQWVHHHIVEISVTSASDHACCLRLTASFSPPGGILGFPLGWLYKARLRSQYSVILRDLLRDLRSRPSVQV